MTPHPMEVVVAVATYRRPGLIEGLLPDLIDQAHRLEHRTRILVVDNDPAQSARDLVRAFATSGVEYFAEPRPGISAARNRALDEAGRASVLVFMDDDERPAPDWLSTLVCAWESWQCTAVAGPVISEFEGPVDAWVALCPTFRRRRNETGTEVRGAATNNLLLDLDRVKSLGVRFDDQFGLTGGGDTLFTHTLVKRGGLIRWCDEAVVSETVPASRATRAWALRRSFRTGNGWVRVKLALSDPGTPRLRAKLRLMGGAGAGLILGGVWALGAIVRRDLGKRVVAELRMATALGALRGTIGHVATEYLRST